jgi:hypothetical protein
VLKPLGDSIRRSRWAGFSGRDNSAARSGTAQSQTHAVSVRTTPVGRVLSVVGAVVAVIGFL